MLLIPLVVIIVSAIGAILFFILPGNKQASPEDADRSSSSVAVQSATPDPVSPPSQEIGPSTDIVSAFSEIYTYDNDTYTAVAHYFTPKRVRHEILVTLEIQNDVIASADVQYDRSEAKTPSHQGFDGAYKPLTVGVAVDDLDLSRVGGASLTTTAFNEALEDIKSDAASG